MVVPGCGGRALELLADPVAAVEMLAVELEACLVSSVVLVVDDFQVADDVGAVVGSLAHFVERIPPLLHLIVASRRQPGLAVDRLRGRGQLGEVGFAELRLSAGEAGEMLARLAPWMPPAAVAAAVEGAGGWAAGVRLAAVAARSERAFEGGGRPGVGVGQLVYDYVWHEVLAGEDPELVAVLLDVAVVEGVDSGLAGVLAGRGDAGDLLVRAEARGLFVHRLGPDGRFEVHPAVRAALLAELARTAPQRLIHQHVVAAKWFEWAGEVELALGQWLLAGEPRQALRLLAAEQGGLYDGGRESVIGRTIAAIPVETSTADLEAMVDFAWCHVLVSRRRFVELVEQMNWVVEHGGSDEDLRGRVTILGSMAAMISGRAVEGGQLAREALQITGDWWWRDPVVRFGWNLVARQVALTETWDDSADDVRQGELALGRDPWRRVAFEATRALGHALAGRPLDALRVAAGVRGAVPIENMTVLRSELAAAEAVAHREIGDRSRALAELQALAAAPAQTTLYCRLLAMVELTHAHLDAGDLAAAQHTVAAAQALVEAESFGADGRTWLARAGARVALAAGAADTAQHWTEQIDDPFWGPATTAGVQLARGEQAAAAATLAAAIPRGPRHEVILALLQSRSTADHDQALKWAAAAVDQAAANGLLQTIVSQGPELTALIERAAWRAPQPWMERLRRASVDTTIQLRPTAHEPLTDRERDVLRFLPSRLTLAEIASELYISPNTLKFHLKVIYRKLGINSRTQAADEARRLLNNNHPDPGR